MTTYKTLQETLKNLRADGYELQVKLSSKTEVLLAELKRLYTVIEAQELELLSLTVDALEDCKGEMTLMVKAQVEEQGDFKAELIQFEVEGQPVAKVETIVVEAQTVDVSSVEGISSTVKELVYLITVALPLALIDHVRQVIFERWIDMSWPARYGINRFKELETVVVLLSFFRAFIAYMVQDSKLAAIGLYRAAVWVWSYRVALLDKMFCLEYGSKLAVIEN